MLLLAFFFGFLPGKVLDYDFRGSVPELKLLNYYPWVSGFHLFLWCCSKSQCCCYLGWTSLQSPTWPLSIFPTGTNVRLTERMPLTKILHCCHLRLSFLLTPVWTVQPAGRELRCVTITELKWWVSGPNQRNEEKGKRSRWESSYEDRLAGII